MSLITISTTPAPLHTHVLVVLEHDFALLVQVQHGYAAEAGGHAASLGHEGRVGGVDQILDYGVVGGVQVVRQGERTVAVAVEGVVARRRDDPVVPADVGEVHVERVPPAVLPAVLATILPGVGPASPAGHYVRRRGHSVPAVVRVREQDRTVSLPVLVAVVQATAQPHMLLLVVGTLGFDGVTGYLQS